MPLRLLPAALLAFATLLGAGSPARAQGPIDERFAEPDLPTPDLARLASGQPGPAYWQQRADYAIRVTLDPATHTVTGSETITYANNSPDTLAFLWLQLDQNLFAPGSAGAQVFPPEGRFGGGGFEGGYDIRRVASGGAALDHTIRDTEMRIELPAPLPPGATFSFEIDWSFAVPENGADRMGRDGDLYLLAQWYPRMAVYDDVSGWNTMPYLGQGEFYLEYGDFDVAITVPATHLVGATGALENPAEVLTAAQRSALDRARGGAEVVPVVAAAELSDPASFRPTTTGTLTWRFRAENVRDFVWAAGPRLVWDATGWEGTLIHALYRPEATQWREAAAMTRHSIEFYSDYLIPYPYPAATAIEGPVFGMEYPMVVFVAPETTPEGLFDVLDHEWGHMWFPMIVGSDERRYAWMDEGFNTFINLLSKKAYFPESEPVLENTAQYASLIRAYSEQPIASFPDEFDPGGPGLGVGGYIKPGVMMTALREIGGHELFDETLVQYTRAWAYKHPMPADFFRMMEDGLGMELGWFWHNWIWTTQTSDLAILGVDQTQSEGTWTVTVTIDQRGRLLMPAAVTATAGTATNTVTIPVQAFYGTDRATATLNLPAKAEEITVNAGPEWGDINPQNNTWTD